MRKHLPVRTLLFLATFFLLSCASLHAQDCDSLLRYYGSDHSTSKMFLTKNGGQLFAGRLQMTAPGSAAYLLKTNNCGVKAWEKYYASTPAGYHSWYARAFDQSAEGDVFALISADSVVGTTRNQMRLFKINSQGDEQWMRIFQDNSFDIVPYGVCATADGGALCGGWKGFWSSYPNTALLVKFDKDGSVQWQQSYGNGLISSIRQVQDGYVFIRYDWTKSKLRSFLYKINNKGVTQWHVETPPDYRYKYTDQYADWAVQVMPKADNSAYTVVRTQGAGYYPDTIFLTKYNSSGGLMWNKKYAYHPYQEIHSIQNTLDDGYLLCGNYSDPVNDTLGIYLMRLDTNGDTVWTSQVTKTAFTFDYPLILSGGTDAYDLGNGKYDIGGQAQVNTEHGSNVTIRFYSLLIKFEHPLTPQFVTTRTNKIGLVKVTPNPASSFCIVEIPGLKSKQAEIQVSDSYGRILRNVNIPAGQTSIRLDIHEFVPGIYAIKVLSDGALTATAKFMVQ